MSDPQTLIDVAGASMGGAGRWLMELDRYVKTTGQGLYVTGRGRSLSATSLVARERAVLSYRPSRVVATNNISFAAPGTCERVVLVRNALHFLTKEEAMELGSVTVKTWQRQGVLVRALLRRATLVVAPSSSMAARIASFVPALSDRVVVRFHPLSPGTLIDPPGLDGAVFRLLCPVLDAPFKRLQLLLAPVLSALDIVASRTDARRFTFELTMNQADAGVLARNRPWLIPLGRLTVEEIDRYRDSARALVYPTTLESFGYPLAEARVEGRWVLAPDSPHNREIAGPALVPYGGDVEELAHALVQMISGRHPKPMPDPMPFDPEAYFNWLLSGPLPP